MCDLENLKNEAMTCVGLQHHSTKKKKPLFKIMYQVAMSLAYK